jgi:hypothetical protein
MPTANMTRRLSPDMFIFTPSPTNCGTSATVQNRPGRRRTMCKTAQMLVVRATRGSRPIANHSSDKAEQFCSTATRPDERDRRVPASDDCTALSIRVPHCKPRRRQIWLTDQVPALLN